MKLFDFTQNKAPYGNEFGKEVFSKMREYVEKHKNITIFEISFEDIRFVDASFSRESLILLAQLYKGKKGFYISHLSNDDVIDNIDYAAKALEQPLTLKKENNEICMLGPSLTKSNLEIFNILMTKNQVTTSQIASLLNLSVQNASIKLKKLVDEGYILRFEETAESGGIEFVYKSIK